MPAMTERPARVDRTIWLLALFVLGAFFLISDVNQQPKATFADMLDGTAYRPYVTRLLVPQTAQAVGALLPADARSGLAAWVAEDPVGYALDWIAVRHDRTLETGRCRVGALRLAGRFHLCAASTGSGPGPRSCEPAGPPGPGADSCSFSSTATSTISGAAALDAARCCRRREPRWGAFLGLTALAALNKETILLLPGFWLVYGWFLGDERKGMPYWQLFFAQLAIVLPIYALISWLHRNQSPAVQLSLTGVFMLRPTPRRPSPSG